MWTEIVSDGRRDHPEHGEHVVQAGVLHMDEESQVSVEQHDTVGCLHKDNDFLPLFVQGILTIRFYAREFFMSDCLALGLVTC